MKKARMEDDGLDKLDKAINSTGADWVHELDVGRA
jgi:hypothetical protein